MGLSSPAQFQGTLTSKLKEQFDAGLLAGQVLHADFTMAQPLAR